MFEDTTSWMIQSAGFEEEIEFATDQKLTNSNSNAQDEDVLYAAIRKARWLSFIECVAAPV